METNCFEITLELECDKFPPAEKLTQLWWDNIDALFNFMFQVTDIVDFFHAQHLNCSYMSLVVRKSVFGVSDQVRQKLGCMPQMTRNLKFPI